MNKIFTSIIGTAFGTAISGTFISGSIIIMQNRKEARTNIHNIHEVYNLTRFIIEYLEATNIGSHGGPEKTQEWYQTQLTNQNQWLMRPIHKQLESPPLPIFIGNSRVEKKTQSWF